MKTRFLTRAGGILLALQILAAAHPAASQLVNVKNAGDALGFQPIIESKGLVLTVTGPCGYFHTDRSKGELVFRLPREAQDGRYNFSIDALPIIEPKVMEILRAARETGDNGRVRELCRDGRLPTGPTNQSGTFTISDGKIILDTTPERYRSDIDGKKLAAEAPAASPEPAPAELAAVDSDPPVATTRLAEARPKAAGECVWARMLPGAGVAER